MTVQPYLIYDGRCAEAIEFYRKALGAEVQMMMRFKDSPQQGACPGGQVPAPDAVMHACVSIGGTAVMASDGMSAGGKPEFKGFSLSYTAQDEADARRRFAALGEGGRVEVPLMETFFAKSFGVVADRFGVSWMVVAGPKNP